MSDFMQSLLLLHNQIPFWTLELTRSSEDARCDWHLFSSGYLSPQLAKVPATSGSAGGAGQVVREPLVHTTYQSLYRSGQAWVGNQPLPP